MNSLVRSQQNIGAERVGSIARDDCEGFLCQGGEFCVDDGKSICAERARLCINESLRCDGVANCAENDDSDEHRCYVRSTNSVMTLAVLAAALFATLGVLVYRTIKWQRRLEQKRRLEKKRNEYVQKMAETKTKRASILKQRQQQQHHYRASRTSSMVTYAADNGGGSGGNAQRKKSSSCMRAKNEALGASVGRMSHGMTLYTSNLKHNFSQNFQSRLIFITNGD